MFWTLGAHYPQGLPLFLFLSRMLTPHSLFPHLWVSRFLVIKIIKGCLSSPVFLPEVFTAKSFPSSFHNTQSASFPGAEAVFYHLSPSRLGLEIVPNVSKSWNQVSNQSRRCPAWVRETQEVNRRARLGLARKEASPGVARQEGQGQRTKGIWLPNDTETNLNLGKKFFRMIGQQTTQSLYLLYRPPIKEDNSGIQYYLCMQNLQKKKMTSTQIQS